MKKQYIIAGFGNIMKHKMSELKIVDSIYFYFIFIFLF